MSCDLGDYTGWLRSHAHGNVVEIGVREGHSTTAILAGLELDGGHLWSIDKDDYGHLHKGNAQWTFIQGNTLTEPEHILDLTTLRSNNVWMDLLFIDGDHTYSGCLSDLTNFAKYAKVIAVHDTHSEYMGVWHAIIEYFRSPWAGRFARAEFFTACHGLGVLYR